MKWALLEFLGANRPRLGPGPYLIHGSQSLNGPSRAAIAVLQVRQDAGLRHLVAQLREASQVLAESSEPLQVGWPRLIQIGGLQPFEKGNDFPDHGGPSSSSAM